MDLLILITLVWRKIEYHKAEFGIIGGCYYNERRNNTINHAIKDLYDLRKKLKPERIMHRWLLNC